MAGSYKHCVTDAGELRQGSFEDMIENLGDAYEAIEEMYGMVWYLAQAFSDPVGAVDSARRNYQEGLALSPGPERS